MMSVKGMKWRFKPPTMCSDKWLMTCRQRNQSYEDFAGGEEHVSPLKVTDLWNYTPADSHTIIKSFQVLPAMTEATGQRAERQRQSESRNASLAKRTESIKAPGHCCHLDAWSCGTATSSIKSCSRLNEVTRCSYMLWPDDLGRTYAACWVILQNHSFWFLHMWPTCLRRKP